MMPLWLQLTAALSAALMSGVMGAALLPFLRKMRFCMPETDAAESDAAAGERLRPTMCGLLAVFGCLGGLGLNAALYTTFCVPDRTSGELHAEVMQLLTALFWAICSAGAGVYADFRLIRRKMLYRIRPVLRTAFVFTAILLLLLICNALTGESQPTVMDFGFRRWDAGWLYYPLTAAAGSISWLCAADMEETQGMSLSTGCILLLGLTIILISGTEYLPAILALTAAGGCMGNLIWNIHPSGGHIGRTGSWWLSGMVTGICIANRLHSALALISLVYILDRLPALAGKGGSLQKRLAAEGRTPWQRIAVLSVFAVFSAAAAVYVQQ